MVEGSVGAPADLAGVADHIGQTGDGEAALPRVTLSGRVTGSKLSINGSIRNLCILNQELVNLSPLRRSL